MSSDYIFKKENIDQYLKELAKDFVKLNGRTTPAEIIIVGGASILLNYNFRDATQDIDAYYRASSAMKDAIRRTGDRLGLPNGWLNQDFTNVSGGVERKLLEHSKHYRTYNHILEIRTVSSEFLVAMKLDSGRPYKNDMSDIVGILREEAENGTPLTLNKVDYAVCELYGSWEQIGIDVKKDFDELISLSPDELSQRYEYLREKEISNKRALIAFEKAYPGQLKKDNMKSILENISKPSVLAKIKERQALVDENRKDTAVATKETPDITDD